MPDTAIETAYNAIRESIFDRKFLPGFHLREEYFAEVFDMSRTPVRQAIRQLADEGLVDIKDNGRSYVSDVSEEDIETVFDLVSMVESYSAGLAAKNITPEQIQKLKDIQEKLEAGDKKDDKFFLEANHDFHKTIHEASGSRLAQRLIKQVIHLSVICYLSGGKHTENEPAIKQHREIIEALESGDPSFARLKMQIHIESVRHEYRNILKDRNSEI